MFFNALASFQLTLKSVYTERDRGLAAFANGLNKTNLSRLYRARKRNTT